MLRNNLTPTLSFFPWFFCSLFCSLSENHILSSEGLKSHAVTFILLAEWITWLRYMGKWSDSSKFHRYKPPSGVVLQYTIIYLAAICIQQMPVNISLWLWTISMMEEADEGSYGRRAEFLPPTLIAQIRSRVEWGTSMFCMCFVPSYWVLCDNNNHNTQDIINETVVFSYYRLTCVRPAQPWAKYKASLLHSEHVFFWKFAISWRSTLQNLSMNCNFSFKGLHFSCKAHPLTDFIACIFFNVPVERVLLFLFWRSKMKVLKNESQIHERIKFPNVAMVSFLFSQIPLNYCFKSAAAQVFDILVFWELKFYFWSFS